MTSVLSHAVQWTVAAPLWPRAAPSGPAAMGAPALLCFKSDRFMDEIQARLAAAPVALDDLVAVPETDRELAPGDGGDPGPLKLFQPAHGRFYLVAANLVCRLPGLPDHRVDPGRGDKAGFVLRRLRDDGGEDAWVPDPADARAHTWAPVASGAPTPAGEEMFPMFPLPFALGDKKRRLLAGYLPVASRETFAAAADGFAPAGAEGPPLALELAERVGQPYRALHEEPDPDPAAADAQLQQDLSTSRYLLADLAGSLQAKLPALWSALASTSRPSGGTQALFDLLQQRADSGSATTWAAALQTAAASMAAIAQGDPGGLSLNLKTSPVTPDAMDAALLAAGPESAAAAPQPSGQVPKLGNPGAQKYLVRCIYQRPQCAPFRGPIVSAPSAVFTLSAFFDPDAPSRPIRITLPIDVSVAGLRKFKKNVGFVLSPPMRVAMSKVGPDILKGKTKPAGTFDLGEICSFSIPIITICAFIILMVILSLLNIVFSWMPFFKICLPIPRQR